MTVAPGSPPPAPRSLLRGFFTGARSRMARTAIVVAGCGFVTASLAAACLDHYDEEYGCTKIATTGSTSGGYDCDASTGTPDTGIIGSGSGSAVP